MTSVFADGRFVKKRVHPIRKHGQFRGEGTIVVNERDMRISGKHVYFLATRLTFGALFFVGMLVFTRGTFAPGIFLVYLGLRSPRRPLSATEDSG